MTADLFETKWVAALYVDAKGPYPTLPAVDCWDESRDATQYPGPFAVVSHPPCGPWGGLRHMRVPNRERRAQDAEMGPVAVAQVQRWGGVLEQPAGSLLWDHCGLPKPPSNDEFGFAVQVEQVAWGHPARKKTWLYFVGVPRDVVESTVRVGGAPTHWVSGGRNVDRRGSGGVVPPGIRVCSAQQRRRTPIAFAWWLTSLARLVDVEARRVA